MLFIKKAAQEVGGRPYLEQFRGNAILDTSCSINIGSSSKADGNPSVRPSISKRASFVATEDVESFSSSVNSSSLQLFSRVSGTTAVVMLDLRYSVVRYSDVSLWFE